MDIDYNAKQSLSMNTEILNTNTKETPKLLT